MKHNIALNDQQVLKPLFTRIEERRSGAVLGFFRQAAAKSVIASDIVLTARRKQQLVIAHRNELVAQNVPHIANRGIPHRIIASEDTIWLITRQHRKNIIVVRQSVYTDLPLSVLIR